MYVLGSFRLDAETDTLFRGGEPVSLGHRAVALLRVRRFSRLSVTSAIGESGGETAESWRIGQALTSGLPPRNNGLVEAAKLNESNPHPSKVDVLQRVYRAQLDSGRMATSKKIGRAHV